MESFQIFVDVLTKNIEQQDINGLIEILRNGRKYFENIPSSDVGSVLSILFDEKKGLVGFIRNQLIQPAVPKLFDNVIKEGLQLFDFIMVEFKSYFERYLMDTKKLCEMILLTNHSHYIKKCASSIFENIIMLFPEFNMMWSETIKNFIHALGKATTKERTLLYLVLGRIIKNNPESVGNEEYANFMFRYLRSDLMAQFKPGAKLLITEVEVYLETISDMLCVVEPHSGIRKQYYKDLYGWIKILSQPEKYGYKKTCMRAAIDLLSSQLQVFCELFRQDYQHWHQLFSTLVQDKNKDNHQCGHDALRSFYSNIAKNLGNTPEDEETFTYLKTMLDSQLTQGELTSTALSLAIYGYSQMATPCKLYLTEDHVTEMYSFIANSAIPLCSSDDVASECLERICDYQEALSEILINIATVTIDHMNVLVKLSTFIVKHFPGMSYHGQPFVINSLMKTIIKVDSIDINIGELFFYNLVYDGIKWSCSHTLFIDVELHCALNDEKKRPISYKNYLPLWTELLKRKGQEKIGKRIFDQMIQVCIQLIDKLNLNTKKLPDTVFSDISLNRVPEQEADYRIFLNLIDLYVDLITDMNNPELWKKTVHTFLYEIIKLSHRHPSVSGFYKLVNAVFKSSDIFEKEITKDVEISELVCNYLSDTINSIQKMSNELQQACLNLILNAPMIYVKKIVKHTNTVFEIAFEIGLNNLEFAYAALNVLEKWINHLGNKETKEFVRMIIPHLEPYLQSKQSTIEFRQDILKTRRKVIKKLNIVENDKTLENFQRRVLLFFGTLDSDIMLDLVHRGASNVKASWDPKDLLKYNLVFPDINLEIYFDSILPRIIDLAQFSGDPRTKINACEVLHAMVAFIVGTTAQNIGFDPDRFVCLYKLLYPVLLNLSCDSDEIVRQLFQPLTIQLTRWMSSQYMRDSPAIKSFLEAIFHGLSHNSNPTFREFSGMCLSEFIKWSIKQTSYKTVDQSPVNVHKIILKMISFGLHPSINNRIGAAIAFNHLYQLLRESNEIINMYWLEMLYCFVKSLDGCNDPSIHDALNHIDRVLEAKVNLLQINDSKRRIPNEFKGQTLQDASNWLFTQCGSLDENCRTKSMEMFVKITKYLNSCNQIESYIETNGMEEFNNVVLKGLKSKPDWSSSKDILFFIKTLDCYNWMIREKLIDKKYLFTNLNSQKDMIFQCIESFIVTITADPMETEENVQTLQKKEQSKLSQCNAIVKIFNFVEMVLSLNDPILNDTLLKTRVCELISKCTMKPRQLGVYQTNVDSFYTLPKQLEQLITILSTEDLFFDTLKQQLIVIIENEKDVLNLNRLDADNELCCTMKWHIRGLAILKRCNVVQQIDSELQPLSNTEENLEIIFKSLMTSQFQSKTCMNYKPIVAEYLQEIVQLLLEDYKPSKTKKLIDLILNEEMIFFDTKKVKHGSCFLNKFKNPILNYMLKRPENTVNFLHASLNRDPLIILSIIEELLLMSQKTEFEDVGTELVYFMVDKFDDFQRSVNNNEIRRETFINIYGLVAKIHSSHQGEKLRNWVYEELIKSKDMEYTIKLLDNFLNCLNDNNFAVNLTLRKLRSDRIALCPNNPSDNHTNFLKITNCFKTLLNSLSSTKSLLVYEGVIYFAAGICKDLKMDQLNRHLQIYFDNISEEIALRSLEMVHKQFMDFTDPKDRFDILKEFLLPSLQLCKTETLVCFYENSIKEIYTTTIQSLVGSQEDMERLIVSKIACYELISIMFTKIDLELITNVDSRITNNAIDVVKTGRELLQALYRYSTTNIRNLKTPDPKHKELMRLLHCSAYNCCLSMVSMKDEESFYEVVFGENKRNDQLIWERIIDCERKYHLTQTVKEFPKQNKKLINIRKRMKAKQDADRYSYIHSYNLTASSLVEDSNAYDFNKTHLSNDKETSNMSLIFESDLFNDHECMATICGVLKHIIENEISSRDSDRLPNWLKPFLSTLCHTRHQNVRLFLLKIVSNMQTVFKAFAKFFYGPIIACVTKYLKFNYFNYIVTDIVILLIDWDDIEFTTEENNQKLCQELFETMIDEVIVSKKPDTLSSVYMYNMRTLKTLVQVWKDCLKVPKNLEGRMTNSFDAAFHLILICLTNGMHMELIRRDDVWEYIKKALNNWNDNEDMIKHMYEILGLMLKYLNDEESKERKSMILELVRSNSEAMQERIPKRFIKCIYALSINYPDILETNFDLIVIGMNKVDENFLKAQCLEMLLLSMSQLKIEEIKQRLIEMKFSTFLKNKILSCENISLKIVEKLIDVLTPAEFLPYADLTIVYAKHNESEYRELVYNIFMKIFHKYFTNLTTDDSITKLILASKSVLLSGLLDPSTELQEKSLQFWTEDARFPDKSKDRLIETLKIYSHTLGDVFFPFLSLTMLNLTSKTLRFKQPLFGPLSRCNYNDYKIYVEWRMKNIGSMTPLFAPSLASQMNQMFTQIDYFSQSSSSQLSQNRDFEFKLRATQSLAFEPTQQDDKIEFPMTCREEFDDTFKKPLVPEPAHNKRSARFLNRIEKVGQFSHERAIRLNIQKTSMMMEETSRQKNSVKLYRNYRIGDLPDVEISNSSLIIPLQELLKKDQTICKDLTVAIVSSLINQSTKEHDFHNFIKSINDIFKYILEDQQENNRMVSTILEIIFKCREIDYSPELVAKISKSNEFSVLGTLLLEENLIGYNKLEDEPSKRKKIRLDDTRSNKNSNVWVHLASLYTSMNDLDIVLSIFNNHECGDTIKKASIARATHNWQEARQMYSNAYETSEEGSIKQHCFQGILECSSQMYDWETIDNLVIQKLNNQWNNIWDDEWMDILFPWAMELNLRKVLKQDESMLSFFEASTLWLEDKQKTLILERVFGKELAIMQLHNQPNAAKRLIINKLDEIREQWMGSSPLFTQLRDFNLQVLREISEIDQVLKPLLSNEKSCLNNLLTYWTDKIPTSQDNLLTWDRIISCRRFFQCLLQSKDQDSTQDENNIHEQLNIACLKSGLNLIEAAIHQKNKFVAENHKNNIEQELLSNQHNPSYPRFDFKFTSAKLKYLYGDVDSEIGTKVNYMASSWKYFHVLLKDLHDPTDIVKIKQIISNEALSFIKLMKESEEFANSFSRNPIILKYTKTTSNEKTEVIELLDEYSWKNLKTCCTIAPNSESLVECYYNLSKYCYDKLSSTSGSLDLFKNFLNSTLRVMSAESLKTSHYFPCLLKLKYMEDEDIKVKFAKETEFIPTWMFISWQAQLFSYLGTTIADVVAPIIEQLVEKYPHAVVYTFYLNVDNNLSLLENRSTQRMRRILYESPGIERFLKALEYVVQPELYLRQHLIELSNNLLSNKPLAVEECINKVYPASRQDGDPEPGEIYNVISSYKEKLKQLEKKRKEMIKPYAQELEKGLTTSVNHRRPRNKLKDYSPWLHKYKGDGLEIPGQYTGYEKPKPYYHIKIVRVEPTIRIMTSLRKPIKITFLGNDGKHYSFLVKYGEDLRLDQRVQQLFSIMNKILLADVDCRQRRLSIDTYQVIPLSTSLGIIQWVNDTRSLQDVLHFKISENEKNKYQYLMTEYGNWMNDAAPNKNPRERYKKAISKYSGSRVVTKMNELINKTEWDALRRAFLKLSTSPESFMCFRRNFITSYATMSLAQWILGIGDRHLDNTMIVIESGRSLGIDFGLAFDAAVDQSVPELIPVRLTPQILGILKPFTEKDLLSTTMVHTLNALKRNKESIIACMDVFVNEPIQWTKHIDRSLENRDQIEDIRWLPDRKIQLVMKKLNGIKPSLITLEQLKDYHNDEYYERYCSIVSGTDDGNTRLRATIKDDNLTPEEQIECLLDQATDLNVLGRTWEKWQPWL